MLMYELELPWPPSVNHYKRAGRTVQTKSGKIYQQRVNTAETKLFYYEVWLRIRSLNAIKGFKSFDSATIVGLDIQAHPPDFKKRDIDNILKCVCDSLVKGGLIPDDSQIARLLVERMSTITKGKLIVRVYELDRS